MRFPFLTLRNYDLVEINAIRHFWNTSGYFLIHLKYCSNFWQFPTFKHTAICQSEDNKVIASKNVSIYLFYNHFFRREQFTNKNIN